LNKDCFLNIGFGNAVNAHRVVSILALPSSAVTKMLVSAKERNMAIDGTAGRKVRTLLVMDNGYVVMSGVNATTIIARRNCEDEEA
jgi:regulator of extracellular matrix RemA (YlzA/DUF370 family)